MGSSVLQLIELSSSQITMRENMVQLRTTEASLNIYNKVKTINKGAIPFFMPFFLAISSRKIITFV